MSQTKISPLGILSNVHEHLVLGRRLRTLAQQAQDMMPETGSVLDVGCGNGVISRLIMQHKPGLKIKGIDVLARPSCDIDMQTYDGSNFPFPDNSHDVVIFMDVLHHTDNQLQLLQEAMRVARVAVIIKDHLCQNRYAERVLAFMDWVGNRAHGVSLPYNYWSSQQWSEAWRQLGVQPDIYNTKLGIYPWFIHPLFESGLHFMARLPVTPDT